jgi:opacity protein-like surface antigen
MVGLQRSVTTQTSTSGVNVLVNTALNNYLVAAGAEPLPSLTNYLAGPLPALSQTVEERSKVLTVAPFELKYTVTKLGRFRPYAVAGLGGYVWIGSDNNVGSFNANTALGSLASLPVGTSTLGATLNALLQGSQIGGLAPTAPELAARGVPHGQGNVLFGGQIGGGAEVRITPKLSMGFDIRHNQVEGHNASFNTFAFNQGLHW